MVANQTFSYIVKFGIGKWYVIVGTDELPKNGSCFKFDSSRILVAATPEALELAVNSGQVFIRCEGVRRAVSIYSDVVCFDEVDSVCHKARVLTA